MSAQAARAIQTEPLVKDRFENFARIVPIIQSLRDFLQQGYEPVLCLDIDGTLIDSVNPREKRFLPKTVQSFLALGKNCFFFITGRSHAGVTQSGLGKAPGLFEYAATVVKQENAELGHIVDPISQENKEKLKDYITAQLGNKGFENVQFSDSPFYDAKQAFLNANGARENVPVLVQLKETSVAFITSLDKNRKAVHSTDAMHEVAMAVYQFGIDKGIWTAENYAAPAKPGDGQDGMEIKARGYDKTVAFDVLVKGLPDKGIKPMITGDMHKKVFIFAGDTGSDLKMMQRCKELGLKYITVGVGAAKEMQVGFDNVVQFNVPHYRVMRKVLAMMLPMVKDFYNQKPTGTTCVFGNVTPDDFCIPPQKPRLVA